LAEEVGGFEDVELAVGGELEASGRIEDQEDASERGKSRRARTLVMTSRSR
jgi:hypothetical protein